MSFCRRSISKFRKRICSVRFARCARRDESCGRTNRGCFTTTKQFLAEKNIAGLELLHSFDLASCDLFLFHKLMEIIKGTRFEGVKAIKRTVTTELRGSPEDSF